MRRRVGCPLQSSQNWPGTSAGPFLYVRRDLTQTSLAGGAVRALELKRGVPEEPQLRTLRFITMTRYFFDISGIVGRFQIDAVGEELPDDSAAWHEALAQVRTVEDSLAPGGTLQLRVRKDGRLVFELQVSSRCFEPPPIVTSPSIDPSDTESGL